MEHSISATEANREFSRILKEVAGGETYVVTSRGKPLARMEPIKNKPASAEAIQRKVHQLVDELGALPMRAPGRITRDDGYE